MRYGYWLPVFGGWLRNVENEGMQPTWDYVSRLARRSEQIGYSLTLIAELNLNDIKGVDAPALDAWSTAAALAAVTRELELMVAVRPTFHLPALLAKQAANIDHISNGRVSLNVVSSCGQRKPANSAFISSSTTIVMPAPQNGWTSSIARGSRITFPIPGNTIPCRTRSCSRSPLPNRGRRSMPEESLKRQRT